MGAGPVSNNPSVNVVPGADQSSTIDKVQTGANKIHQTTKTAVEDQGFKTLSIVSWGKRIVNKLGIAGYPITLLLSPVLLPLSFLYDGYRCVRLLSRKITNLETPVQKLLPMTAQQAEDAAKLKHEKDTLESKNAELSDEVAAWIIEAGQLYSAKAYADQRLVQLQQQNNQLGYKVAQLQNEKTDAEARVNSAESRVSSLTKAADLYNREKSGLELKLQQKITELEQDLENRRVQMDNLGANNRVLEDRVHLLARGNSGIKAELDSKIEDARKLAEEVSKYKHGLQELLRAAHRNPSFDLDENSTGLPPELMINKVSRCAMVARQKIEKAYTELDMLKKNFDQLNACYVALMESAADADADADKVVDDYEAELAKRASEYQAELAERGAEIRRSEDQLEVVKTLLIKKDRELRSAHIELKKQMVTQAETESRVSGLQRRRPEDSKASAERLKEGFEDEQKKLKAVLAQQIGECQQLEARLHKTKQAVKNIIKDRAAQKERLQQTRDTLHQTEQTVIKFGRENKRLKAESTQLKENDSTLADTREQLAELSQHLQQLKLNNTELSQDNERIQESKGLAKQFIEDKEPEIARLTEQLQKVEETLNRWQSMKAIENETFQALPDRKKELIAVLLEEHVIEERIVLEKGDEYFLECTRNLHYSERELKKRLEEKERIIREGGVAGVESAAMASLEYVLTKERSKQPDIHTVKEMAKCRLIDGARAEEDLAMAKTEISYHEKEKDELLELSVRLGWSKDELTRENRLLQSRSEDLEAHLEFRLQSDHDQMQSDYTQMESQILAQQLKDRPLSNPQQNGYGDALETSVKH